MSGNLVLSTCLVLLTILLWIWYQGRKRKITLLSHIPGPKGFPLIGNVLEFALPPLELFKHIVSFGLSWREKTPVILIWMLQQPEVITVTPETTKAVLSSKTNIDKSVNYDIIQPWLGTGLVTSGGDKWRTRRKMLTPTLHFKILGDFLDVMNEKAKILRDQVEKYSNGPEFDIHPYITRCTLDVICETAMGTTINAQENKDLEFVKSVERVTRMVIQRIYYPWLPFFAKYWQTRERIEFEKNLGIFHGFTRNIINLRRKDHSKRISEENKNEDQDYIGMKRRFAFLDHLIEMSNYGEHLTDEDIREEVDTFMFAGHDTTASAIGWSIYLIGRDPEVQARIRKEQLLIFEEDKDRSATMEDLRKMQYLECCVKEALRLFPSVPYISRNITEDLECDKYIIPSGTTATIMPYIVHRDPHHWPDPEVYNPDRFTPENSINRHPFAYIPFSAGPRNCIGQKFAMLEVKTILSTLFRNYNIESTVCRDNLKLVSDLILKSDDGILLKLHQI